MADVPLMENPMTTAGDVIKGGVSGAPTRLAKGTDGQVLTLAAGVPSWAASGAAAFAGARVTNTAVQSLTTATWTSLTFDTERFDTDAFHSTATNTSRITIPAGKGGTYMIGGIVGFAGSGVGTRNVRLYLNNTTRIADIGHPPHATAAAQRFGLTTIYDLVATDYVELQAYQDTGAALNTATTGEAFPNFWAYRVG